MNTEEYIKRFCFTVDKEWLKRYGVSLPAETIDAHFPEIENLEIFKNDTFAFIVLDVVPQFDLITLKKHLKNQSEKPLPIQLLEDLMHSEAPKSLDRIFSMHPEDNHFVEKNIDYKRTVMTLELFNDEALLEAYRKVHQPDEIWPQIIINMKTIGVTNMELYLDGYQAFLLMDTRLGFDMEKDGERWASLPREKEWQEYVAKFQKVDPESNATEKWKSMMQIGWK